MVIFDRWTYQQAEAAVPDRAAAWLRANAAFYHGDHWQDGDAWTGPRLALTHPLYAETWQTIKDSFVSANKIREVVRRETMAAVGDVPGWALTPRRPLKQEEQPSPAEAALIDEATALFQDWWDKRQAHGVLEEATAVAAWAKRGVLRLFVPPGRLQDGLLPVAPLTDAVDYLYLECPDAQQATVATDARTRSEVGIYLYEEQVDGQGQLRAELCYLADDGRTMVRVIGLDGQDVQEPVALALDGRLLVYEMRRPALITEQTRAIQKALNKALTMLDRNGTQGGFLERIVTNAQLPGRMEPDPLHPGLERFVPEAMHLGPGTTNFLAGLVTHDANGNEAIATPGVHYRDPVSPATFVETKDALYRILLEECHQAHVLLSGSDQLSGESRKQARAEFAQAVRLPAALAEDALTWLIETVLAAASLFAGQPGRFASLRASVTANVDVGPISADEIRVNSEQVVAELLSPETAMSRNGVRDVPAELERIAAAKAARADLAQEMLEQARRSFDRGQEPGTGGQGIADA